MISPQRKVIKIFIATPGDLSKERELLKGVVDRLNKILGRRMNVHFDLYGWEDTIPGYTRPQGLINKDVENCDIFIGALWKRWGTSTGISDSGFKEEFDIATKRQVSNSPPRMIIYFRNVDEDSLKDPGSQLQKVLQFKGDLIKENKLLFKEYKIVEEFERNVSDHLTTIVFDLLEEAKTEENNETKISPENESKTPSKDERSSQLNSEIRNIIDKVSSASFEDITYWERLRNLVFSLSLYAEYNSSRFLDVHELHLVYKKRKEWDLTDKEKDLLIRTFLASDAKTIPGWYWLGSNKRESIESTLRFIVKYEYNKKIAVEAISLIRDIVAIPDTDLLRELFEQHKNNAELIRPLLNYASASNDNAVLEFVKPYLNDSHEDVRKEAINAYVSLLYEVDPDASFDYLIDNSVYVPTKLEKLKSQNKFNLKKDLLVRAINKGNEKIREFSAGCLFNTKQLDEEMANKLLNDPDSWVRKIGFEWLVDNGIEKSYSEVEKLFPDENKGRSFLLGFLDRAVNCDDIYKIILKKKSKDQLLDIVNIYGNTGKLAYEVLCEKDMDQIKSDVRGDLDDNFTGLEKRSRAKLAELFKKVGETFTPETTPGVSKYLRDNFVASALKGLVLIAEPDDIKYARQYIGKTELNLGDEASIDIISKFGSEDDLKILLEVARNNFSVQEKALTVAMKFAKDRISIIKEFLKSEHAGPRHNAIKLVKMLGEAEQLRLYKEFLNFDDDYIRSQSAIELTKLLDSEEVEKLLDNYIEHDTYYYNVVYIFDRSLYKSLSDLSVVSKS